MLLENSLFGTVDKVQIAIQTLKDNEPPEGYYVCFSGGKDSVVILDLVKRAGVKFEAHHHIMTIEPPELMNSFTSNILKLSILIPVLLCTNLFKNSVARLSARSAIVVGI